MYLLTNANYSTLLLINMHIYNWNYLAFDKFVFHNWGTLDCEFRQHSLYALNVVSIYILKSIFGNLLSKFQNNFCSFYNVKNSSGDKVVNILWNVKFSDKHCQRQASMHGFEICRETARQFFFHIKGVISGNSRSYT